MRRLKPVTAAAATAAVAAVPSVEFDPAQPHLGRQVER
jgi:hypothetical protein